MNALRKIQASAQAGMRNLAISHQEIQSPEPPPHRRHQNPGDKLYCEIINGNSLLWSLPKVPKHARHPKHAKGGV